MADVEELFAETESDSGSDVDVSGESDSGAEEGGMQPAQQQEEQHNLQQRPWIVPLDVDTYAPDLRCVCYQNLNTLEIYFK